jgi:DNA-binding NtrC family response regulator
VARRAARESERAVLEVTLERTGGNRAEAARRLEVSYKTLLKKLHETGVAAGRHEDRR